MLICDPSLVATVTMFDPSFDHQITQLRRPSILPERELLQSTAVMFPTRQEPPSRDQEIRATATAASMTATNPARSTSTRAIENRPAGQAGITRTRRKMEEIYVKCGCLKVDSLDGFSRSAGWRIPVNATRRSALPCLLFSPHLGKVSWCTPAIVTECPYVRTGQPAFCRVHLFFTRKLKRSGGGSRVALHSAHFHPNVVLYAVLLLLRSLSPNHHERPSQARQLLQVLIITTIARPRNSSIIRAR